MTPSYNGYKSDGDSYLRTHQSMENQAKKDESNNSGLHYTSADYTSAELRYSPRDEGISNNEENPETPESLRSISEETECTLEGSSATKNSNECIDISILNKQFDSVKLKTKELLQKQQEELEQLKKQREELDQNIKSTEEKIKLIVDVAFKGLDVINSGFYE